MGWVIGGLSPGRGWEFFSTSLHPDQLWGPLSLLSNDYQGSFNMGKRGQGVKLTAHLHLVQGQECMEVYLHSPNVSSWHDQLKHRDEFAFYL